MADASFYGGKQGFSFIIVKSFSSVEEMIINFRKGPSYSAVHYDEHVLINTKNKNNPDNGKIFRRGYDYTNSLGGAIYIGTIVGPAGHSPMLELTTIEEVKLKQQIEGYNNRYSEGSYSFPVSLIPGKDGNKYNDTISWACCSIRSENDEDTIAYIGFKIPYLVEEFTAESVSPYYHRSNNTDSFINQNLTERVDDKTHPFYEKWHFNIPKGIKGDSFKNFRVIKADTTVQDYPGRQDDIDNNREILVYDYYHYDKNADGEPVSIYLGDFNIIKNINFNNNGTVTIDYTHSNSKVYNKLIKWIVKTDIKQDGTFVITYNTGEEESANILIKFINSIYIDKDQKIHIVYNTGEETSIGDPIKFIDNVYLNDGNQNESMISFGLFELLNDNTIKILLTKDNYTIENENCLVINDSNIIDNLEIYEQDDSLDYKFHVVYNVGYDEAIGQPINFIKQTIIDKSDYHLLVYYSNARLRESLINTGKARTFGGKKGWFDLGSVKDDSGILIGLNISSNKVSGITEISNAISYLNDQYPNGLTDKKYYGKIVTIGETTENKKFYAFDYDLYRWYYLGSFTDENSWTMIAQENDINLENQKEKLAVGGVWFIIED